MVFKQIGLKTEHIVFNAKDPWDDCIFAYEFTMKIQVFMYIGKYTIVPCIRHGEFRSTGGSMQLPCDSQGKRQGSPGMIHVFSDPFFRTPESSKITG